MLLYIPSRTSQQVMSTRAAACRPRHARTHLRRGRGRKGRRLALLAQLQEAVVAANIVVQLLAADLLQ